MRPLLVLSLLLMAGAAGAETGQAPERPAERSPERPVARLVLAHRLFEAGVAGRDGLAQIAAARLAAETTLHPVTRAPKAEGKGKAVEAPAVLTATQMMAAARKAVEADESLGILLTTVEASATVLPRASLRSSEAGLAALQVHHYDLPADGGIALDIGLLVGPGTRVALEVTHDDAILCRADDFCSVILPESGFVTVTVRNLADAAAGYQLLTN